MKGRFYAPFFYTEYTLDLTVKLARFLRRWQLGVACLDTSRLAALAEDKHTSFFNPSVESTRYISAHQIQRRGSLPLSRLQIFRAAWSVAFWHLLYGFLAYRSHDTSFIYTFEVVEKKQLLFFLPDFHNYVLGEYVGNKVLRKPS